LTACRNAAEALALEQRAHAVVFGAKFRGRQIRPQLARHLDPEDAVELGPGLIG
jgi:hypothetical protein